MLRCGQRGLPAPVRTHWIGLDRSNPTLAAPAHGCILVAWLAVYWSSLNHETCLFKEKKVEVIHLRSLVKESHCRSAKVWHALSRNFTVLPALCTTRVYPRFPTNGLNRACYLPFQPKLVLIYQSWRDARLSWPRYHHSEQNSLPKTAMWQADSDHRLTVSCSSRHIWLGNWSTGEHRSHVGLLITNSRAASLELTTEPLSHCV